MAEDVVRRQRSRQATAHEDEGSVFGGAIVILVLGALLFWLPVLGPVIAGFVGGRMAGSFGRGLVAALLPGIIVAVLVSLLALALPVIGPVLATIIGGAVFLWAVAQGFLTLVGAGLGGYFAQRETRRPTVAIAE